MNYFQVVAVKSEAHPQPNPTPDYATHLSAATLNPPASLAPPVYVPPVPQAAPAAPPPVYAPLPSVTVPLATPQGALPGAPVTVSLPTTPLPQATAGGRLVQLPTQPLPQVTSPTCAAVQTHGKRETFKMLGTVTGGSK
jgi:hypothetical protein